MVTGALFQQASDGGLISGSTRGARLFFNRGGEDFDAVLTGSNINTVCDEFRHRMFDLSFNNTTELNSTVYFCRANNKDFNYSANPTYLTASKIRVKEGVTDPPKLYYNSWICTAQITSFWQLPSSLSP